MEAFGNTLHCRVEINSDNLTCIQGFKLLLVRSLCVGATAEVVGYFEASTKFCHTTGRHIPQDSIVHIRR